MARFKASLVALGVFMVIGAAQVRAGEAEWAHYQQQLRMRQYPAALQTLEQLVAQNDAQAMLTLAQWYRNGTGGHKDAVKSRQLMQNAATHGLAEAQYQLGLMALKGIGGEKNPAFARHWLEAAAQQQHVKARRELAQWQTPEPVASNVASARVKRTEAVPATGKLPKVAEPALTPLQQRLAAVQQSSGQTDALRRAVLKEDRDMVIALFDALNPQQRHELWLPGSDGQTLVTLAAQQASAPMLGLLLKRSESSAWVGAGGRNALFYALKGNRQENIGPLLAAGCDPLQADAEGVTPLAWAIDEGHPAASRLLDATDSKRWQPSWLTVAAHHGDTALVLKLLKSGVPPDAADSEGRTALWYAAQQGSRPLCEALLAASASARQADHNGDTPLHIASQRGHNEVMNLLLASGNGTSLLNLTNAKGGTPLHTASAAGQSRAVETLLQHGADINRRDQAGNTALMLAVSNNRAATVGVLIGQGAALDKRNNNKKNALEMAEQLGHQKVAALLRKAAKEQGILSIFQ